MQQKKKGKHKHKHVKHKKKKISFGQLKTYLVIILGVILLVNVFLIANLNTKLSEKIGEIKESAKPALVELLVLKDSKCDDCFDIDSIVDNIKKSNVNVTKEKTIEANSDEGKNLIERYEIEKLPTVILTGEVNKTNIRDMDEKQDALVFTALQPPYINSEGEVVGRVTVTHLLETSCDDCNDLGNLVKQFKSSGVSVFKENWVNSDSLYGKELIKKYNIKKLPTIIFSPDLGEYDDIMENWQLFGSSEDDDSFVIRTAEAVGIPYYDLEKNRVAGLVDITYLTDESCEECYDAGVHKTIVTERFGIKLGSETSVDISSEEGKQLIEKYNITSVPTVILSEDAIVYSTLRQVWAGVGSIEDDGSFIFRNILAMRGSVFKDLTTGELKGK